MLENRLNNMKRSIPDQILDETRRISDLSDYEVKPSVDDVEPIKLDDFRKAFVRTGDDFLSDKVIKGILDDIEEKFDDIKMYYPKGAKLILAAMPCTIKGDIFTYKQMNDGDYLVVFAKDEETGLYVGYGSLRPSTHALMLPEEIQKDCSFVVEGDNFESFAAQYTKAYNKLRELLKGEES